MKGEQVVILAYRRLLIGGGEFRCVVERRGDERIPIIYEYPENKTRCDTEVIPIED